MKHRQTLHQILVLSGLAFCSISDGFIIGQMSGMLEALRSKNSTIPMNDDDISLLGSIINITCFCGFGLMAAITEIYGRRKSVTMLSVPILICWVMVYFANDKATLMASRITVGFFYGGIMLLTYINIGEYVSPKSRSFWLNIIFCVGNSLGTMLGHIFSIIMHWKYVALVGMIPTAISALLPLFWVESPSWLATKNRFEESERAFRALHIPCEASDYELKVLLEAQRSEMNQNLKKNNTLIQLMRKYIRASKQKYFWKIAFLLIVIGVYRITAGRALLNTLAITIIKEITRSDDILKYTLVLDGLSLFGSCLSCCVVSRFKMRTILFTSGIIINIVQIIFAIVLYFWMNSNSMAWVKIILLAVYFTGITAGPYAVLETLLSELHPLEIKAINTFCFGAICGIMQFVNIQFAFKMFSSIGYHGVFFFHAIVIFFCLLYLYIYLPETKGRTLQEIELYFKNNAFENIPTVSGNEMKILNTKDLL